MGDIINEKMKGEPLPFNRPIAILVDGANMFTNVRVAESFDFLIYLQAGLPTVRHRRAIRNKVKAGQREKVYACHLECDWQKMHEPFLKLETRNIEAVAGMEAPHCPKREIRWMDGEKNKDDLFAEASSEILSWFCELGYKADLWENACLRR